MDGRVKPGHDGVQLIHRDQAGADAAVFPHQNVVGAHRRSGRHGIHRNSHDAIPGPQPFGQRLVNSMLTLATLVGSSVAQLTQGTLVANLGFGEGAFPHPLFLGDTLYSRTLVVEKRLSASRPGQGVVTLLHTGANQSGVEVARANRTALVWCEGERP